MISSQVEKKPVFWKVEESDESHQLQLIGTDSAADASLFHIIPIGDPTHPSEFHIAYWGKRGRQYTMHVDDLFRTYHKDGPPLPHYLSTDTNIVGKSKGSLSLKTCTEIKKARFSLHNRVQSSFTFMMCNSIPIDLCSWLDGEQFYIRCSYHSIFKVDGYLAVEKDRRGKFNITTVLSVAGKDSVKTGMLFRLHPEAIKENAVTEAASTTDTAEQSPPLETTPANVVEESTPPETTPANDVEESASPDTTPADGVEESASLNTTPNSAEESTHTDTLHHTSRSLPKKLLILVVRILVYVLYVVLFLEVIHIPQPSCLSYS